MSLGPQFEEAGICNDIIQYGKDILISDVFRQTSGQRHHLHGTVFDHTINVCVIAVKICREQMRKGVQLNEKDLVQAALCHDLGMIGRDSKYKHVVDTWKSHPKESARIAREMLPELSPEAEEMIRSHMWPLSGLLPKTKEGRILCFADKCASMADWQSWLTKHKYAERIKERLKELTEQTEQEI